MTQDDNIIKMPDRLERRAQKIEAAITKCARAGEDWIDGTVELAVELAGAREDLRSNQAFGEWCGGRFGNNVIPPNERAILVRWGADPNGTRIMLEKADSHSIRVIDRRFHTSVKSTSATTPSGGPALRDATDKILVYEAVEGKLPPANRHFQMEGVTPSTYDRAIRQIISNRAQAEALGQLKFTKATALHIEAIIARRTRELEKDFEERVRLQVLEENAPFRTVLEESKKQADRKKETYDSLLNDHKPIFNEIEFITILACLHPDNSASRGKRNTAFQTFNAMKFQLTGKR